VFIGEKRRRFSLNHRNRPIYRTGVFRTGDLLVSRERRKEYHQTSSSRKPPLSTPVANHVALVFTTTLMWAIRLTIPPLFATMLFGAQSALDAGYTLGLLMNSIAAALVGGVLLRLHRPAE
jgi:hypothetical protein